MSRRSLEGLGRVLQGVDAVLILTHNDPDPDAVASALALQYLLIEEWGVSSRVAYQGIVGRAENKALVRYLGKPLCFLTPEILEGSQAVALVDTQPGAGNNALPDGWPTTIVIDHHTPRQATLASAFADVRPEVGASATILVEYLRSAGLEPAPPLATALFYGIKSDTRGLSRGAHPSDARAFFHLQPRIDVQALAEIEQAQVPASYFRTFAAALRAARVYDGLVVAYVGSTDYPDMAAEMARYLLRLEKARWVICISLYHDVFHLSVRTRDPSLAAEWLVQAMVGEEGTAGGHGPSAGGQLARQDGDLEVTVDTMIKRALGYLGLPGQMRGQPLI